MISTVDYCAPSSAAEERANQDKILIERFKTGDEGAFRALMEAYYAKTLEIVAAKTGNYADAQEVVQDIFIRVHRKLRDFRGDCSFSTWLFHISRNLIRNKYHYWRRRKVSMHVSLDESLSEDDRRTGSAFIDSRCKNSAEILEESEFESMLSESMRLLPEMSSEVLSLRGILKLSYSEIASILGIRVGTVKSRIARARVRLHDILLMNYPGVAKDGYFKSLSMPKTW